MTEGRSTILVLHPSSTDPTNFLQRIASSSKSALTATSTVDAPQGEGSTSANQNDDGDAKRGESSTSGSTSYTSASVPWEIENKYYTASVNFTAYPQEVFEMKEAQGVEVVMYIFEGNVNSLPPGLVRVMATPRDIALAIRICDDTKQAREVSEVEGEKMEDLFDEVGMEYMDESSLPEDDDERPISIEERIRQTLMTHMWPNMIRKPIQSRLDMGFEDDDENYHEEIDGVNDKTKAEFPVTFNPLQTQSRAPTNDLNESANPDDFPGLDELKNQIMLEDLDKRQRGGDHKFSRLDMMDDFDDFDGDDGGDWVGAEYAKLDDWLDENENEHGNENENENEGEDTTQDQNSETPMDDPDLDMSNEEILERVNSGPIDLLEESQFEDDFADFAPFQSAPPTGPGAAGGAGGLDPTPLLLHLQNVREELAGLDEDTRRERAGKEVESVLMSLGLGGLGGSDWEEEI